jgi:Tfp pilus assembly protein PilE
MLRLREILHSEKGVFDLGSIMVGVIITGILAAVAGVSFVVVIPWFQANAVKNDLSAVRIAETSSRQDLSMYSSYPDLVSSNYMSQRKNPVCVSLTNGNKTYAAFSKAPNGDVYTLSSTDDTVKKWTTTVPCTF